MTDLGDTESDTETITVGLGDNGNFTWDIEFTQGSFDINVPTFGGFDANSAANFGFAILSDIEVFFLIQALQGDSRSNVM